MQSAITLLVYVEPSAAAHAVQGGFGLLFLEYLKMC
jgi:hypothetical protein